MTESNLIDQADDLAPGSWTKLQTENGFFDVALTRAEHDAIVQQSGGASFWGTGGPSKVFEAWNSGAYDAAENRMFFMGGGHADYGGNEVYSFDFDTLEWTRVSEPDPLTKSDGLDSNGNPLFIPEDGPLSPHTYEGLTWNPVTETLWLTNTVTGFSSTLSSPNRPPDEAVWEFDPATGEWTKHEVASANNRGSSVFLEETGQILAIENSNRGTFDPTLIDADGGATHGEATEFDPVSGMGTGRIEGNLFTNPVTGQVYQSRKEGIFQLDFVKDSDGNIIDFVDTKIEGSPGSLHQAAFDFADSDGNFYIWNGGREVIRWTPGDEDDPTDDSFETLFNLGGDAPGGGGGGKVFDKFVYLEEAEAFAGIQTADGDGGGIWLFKPGDNPANIDQLDVGAISLDPATSGVINIHVAGGDLDKNGDGRVEIAYRKAGESAWQEAQDLLRQDSGDFAGSILGLDAGTTFEVKVSAQDPDGLVDSADAARIITAETDSLPDAAAAGGANEIRVASVAELQAAIDAATGGEVIVLEAGVHTGTLDIRSSGTADAPITIRGVADGESVIDAGGAGKALRIEGDHLRIEDLSIQNAYTGIALRDGRGDHVDDLVIQGNKITGVTEGIDGNEGHRDIRILDNLLIGDNAFGDTSTETWNDEGIVVTGQGIEVAHNTLAGFGDSLGLNKNTDLANRAIEIHHNQVLWGGDDGIELDFSDRNVQAHHNLLMNTANGISFQFVDEGPAFAFRNVIFNAERGPFKVKPESDTNDGIRLFNNTSIKSGEPWKDFSGSPDKSLVLNNLFLGDGSTADTLRADTTDYRNSILDFNAWSHDGAFQVGNVGSFSSFAAWRDNAAQGDNDVLLEGERIFDSLSTEAATQGFDVFRTVPEGGFTLADGSSAIDAGTIIPGVTDGFTGAAPDIGAVETGSDPTNYGSRVHGELAALPEDDVLQEVATGPVTLDVLANDLSLSGDPLAISRVTQPENGSVAINDDGTLTFTPNSDFVGITRFSYFLDNSNGGEVGAEVTVPVQAPDAVLPGEPVSFDPATIQSYAPDQDGDGTASASSDGSTISVEGNAWKQVAFNYQATSNTLLSFEARVDSEGEIQGIGVDGDGIWDNGNDVAFIVAGTQTEVASRASLNFDFHGQGEPVWKTFLVDLGSSFTGNVNSLTFISDHDVDNPDAAASYRNVRLFESDGSVNTGAADSGSTDTTSDSGTDDTTSGTTDDTSASPDAEVTAEGPIAFTTETFTGYTQEQDQGGTVSVTDGGRTVSLDGNTWQKAAFSYDVTADTVLRVTARIEEVGELQGIGVDADGVWDNGNDVAFVLGGTQTDALVRDSLNDDYRGQAGSEWQTFEIDLGSHFTGRIANLTFLNDHDVSNPAAAASFRDIELFEASQEPANTAPEARDDNAEVLNDSSVTIPVLDNDSDPDGDTLSLASVGEATHGTMAMNDDGTVTFTPDDGFVGEDSFTTTISDGNGGAATSTVSVSVSSPNRAPVAADDSATVLNDSSVTIPVLDNDSDPDGDTLSLASVGEATHGTMAMNDDGTVTFTPDDGFVGEDSFTTTISDGRGGDATSTVSVTVQSPHTTPTLGRDPADFGSYDGGAQQDVDGSVTVAESGDTVTLSGNTWKKVAFDHEVTANTILRFEARIDAEGELHGIGLDGDDVWDNGNDLAFIIGGTQSEALDRDSLNDEFRGQAGAEWQTFEIDLGGRFTGPVANLTFINDHDVDNPDAQASFRSIRLIDNDTGPKLFAETSLSSYDGSSSPQDVNGTARIDEAGTGLTLSGNAWRKASIDHEITRDTVLRFEARVGSEGEIQGIGVDGDGVWGNGNDLAFVLAGTQDDVRTRSELNFDHHGEANGAWQSFEIDLGAHYTGNARNLTFINDHDVDSPDAEIGFRNVEFLNSATGDVDMFA